MVELTALKLHGLQIPKRILPAALSHALQPIIDIQTGLVYGYEALLRGTDEAGYSSIDDFFDRAFAAGETLETELALYELAFAATRRLPHDRGKKIFMNIDNRILEDPNFDPAFVSRLADRMGVHRASVCLELSEKHSSVTSDLGIELIQQMRADGLRIALDDFGQGFSELKLLYLASPDYVKIDRFFVSGIATNARKRLFVTTVVNLAHVLGSRVIAEGVETEEEFLTCRKIGCDLAQGWYIARPYRDFNNLPNVYPLPGTGSRRRRQSDDIALVRSEISNIQAISIETPMTEVLELYQQAPKDVVFPVVDSNREPLGIVDEKKLRSYFYSLTDSPLDAEPVLHLRDFLIRVPIVENDAPIEHILESVATSGNGDGVIITRELEYSGFLSSSALLKVIQEKRLLLAQDQNPLTHLPGNGAINAHVMAAAENNEISRIFCYFDFNHFKPFNDAYGFRQGDRAIMLFADLLRRHFTGNLKFIGHIGGDDFFVSVESDNLPEFEGTVAQILGEFRSDVASFYAAEDRDRGYLKGLDREGREQLFPIISCSAAVLMVPAGKSIETVDLFSRWTAEGKRAAKLSPNGMVTRVMA